MFLYILGVYCLNYEYGEVMIKVLLGVIREDSLFRNWYGLGSR